MFLPPRLGPAHSILVLAHLAIAVSAWPRRCLGFGWWARPLACRAAWHWVGKVRPQSLLGTGHQVCSIPTRGVSQRDLKLPGCVVSKELNPELEQELELVPGSRHSPGTCSHVPMCLSGPVCLSICPCASRIATCDPVDGCVAMMIWA